MRWQGWLAVSAVAVALPGVLRDVSVVFWKQGKLATSRIDDRFAGIAERLPPGERVGFWTDASGPAAGRRYFDALYALAPHLVVEGSSARFVVVDLDDAARLEAIRARWGLRVVARSAPGVALLERD